MIPSEPSDIEAAGSVVVSVNISGEVDEDSDVEVVG